MAKTNAQLTEEVTALKQEVIIKDAEIVALKEKVSQTTSSNVKVIGLYENEILDKKHNRYVKVQTRVCSDGNEFITAEAVQKHINKQ